MWVLAGVFALAAVLECTGAPRGATFARRLALLFAGLLLLDAGFSFTANFGNFVPRSEGCIAERAWFTFVAASGPLSFPLNAMFRSFQSVRQEWEWIALGAALIAAVVLAVWLRRFVVPRILGYAAILGWFLVGCSAAAMRIT